jgi:hypothetical protein
VPVLAPGSYTDMHGRGIAFAAADLAALAENYDPSWHPAMLNLEHADGGPALGRVQALAFDGRYLYADLVQVPLVLAEAIDSGRYPYRSAEVYADLEGRGPYLRAVALLGARPPAVKGLPPMPPREEHPAAAAGTARPEAGSSGGAAASPLQRARRGEGHIITIYSEVPMAPKTAEKPAAEEAVKLAEENHRLAEENRQLRLAQREREVVYFLAELRDQGQLTPAMEDAGLKAALVAAQEHPLDVKLDDGTNAPLGSVLQDVLRALPASFSPGETLEANSSEEGLTPQETEIAGQLGLTAEEFAQVKAGA